MVKTHYEKLPTNGVYKWYSASSRKRLRYEKTKLHTNNHAILMYYTLHTEPEIVYFRKVYDDFCTNSKYCTKAAPDLGEDLTTLRFRGANFKSYEIEIDYIFISFKTKFNYFPAHINKRNNDVSFQSTDQIGVKTAYFEEII